MRELTDGFGRTITETQAGVFDSGGLAITLAPDVSDEQVLRAFEGMAAGDPPAPAQAPALQTIACGYVTVAGGVASAVDGFGFASAARVANARIRFFFAVPQPDANYIVTAGVRHSTDLQWRVSAKTTTYVELRSSAEALEYAVNVQRINR